MAEERPAKKMRFSGNFVTIEVGTTNPATFTVHEAILKGDSDFFKLAVDKKWKEGQERVVKLPEDEASIFSIYVEWLYKEETPVDSLSSLASCYVLGEKIQSAKFCNAIISKMIKRIDRRAGVGGSIFLPNINNVNVIYAGTPANSPARRFIVDIWATFGVTTWLDDGDYDNGPDPEFVLDLAKSLLGKIKNSEKKGMPMPRKDYWYK